MTGEQIRKYNELVSRYERLKGYIDVLQKCSKGVATVTPSQDGRTLTLGYSYLDADGNTTQGEKKITLRSASTGIVCVKCTSPTAGANCKWTFYSDAKATKILGSFELKTGDKGPDGEKDTSTTLYYANGAKKAEYSLTGFSADITCVSSSITGLNVGVTLYSLSLSLASLGAQGIYATGAVFDTEINMAKTYLSASGYKAALQAQRVKAARKSIKIVMTFKALLKQGVSLLRQKKAAASLKVPGGANTENNTSAMELNMP